MCYTISRVDRNHAFEMCLCFFKEVFGRFVAFLALGVLGQVKADRTSVYVKDRVVLVWK